MSNIVFPGGQTILSGLGGQVLTTEQAMPLTTVIPSYPYQEYSDDPNIVAFFTAFNILAQGYLNWFNQTPLAVYTSPSISGPLLDWVLNGIYGIPRPVLTTIISTASYFAGINAAELDINRVDINDFLYNAGSSTSMPATDDYYKRYATWILYLGDGQYANTGTVSEPTLAYLGGRYFNFTMLRTRVARFLYCPNGTSFIDPNGTDVISDSLNVQITASGTAVTITIPPGTSSTYFQQMSNQGFITYPFQLAVTVDIS